MVIVSLVQRKIKTKNFLIQYVLNEQNYPLKEGRKEGRKEEEQCIRMYLKNPKEKWYLKLKNILQKMKKVSEGGREGGRGRTTITNLYNGQ